MSQPISHPRKTNAIQKKSAPATPPAPAASLVHWPIVAAAVVLGVVFVGGLVAALAALGNSKTSSMEGLYVQVTDARGDFRPMAPLPLPVAAPPREILQDRLPLLPVEPEAVKGEVAAAVSGNSPAPPVVEAPKPAEPVKRGPVVVKRRALASDEDLRRQLVLVPEMRLPVPYARHDADRWFAQNSSSYVLSAKALEQLAALPKGRIITPEEAPHVAGLPMRMGIYCQLGKESAEHLQVLSRKMRTAMAQATPQDRIDTRPDAGALRNILLGTKESDRRDWLQPEAIPTLTQMLMAENKPLRLLLVELLSQIEGSKASVALAQRALYDLAPEVREAAIHALADRPHDDFRNVLLNGLRYPWAPVAQHAAETLVALRDHESLPALVRILQEPDPQAPFLSPQTGGAVMPEVVRINHLANCKMCHATSLVSTDPVRGQVPSPSAPLPPPVQYYEGGQGIFVRADVTYLQQDFSVPQPVAHHGQWPSSQRFDYLVRLRPLTAAEVKAARPEAKAPSADPQYEQRDCVLCALRELTGKDAGTSTKSWQKVLEEEMLTKVP